MFIAKYQRASLFRITAVLVFALLIASCGGGGAASGNVVEQYYSAIENGDADTAASFFADDVVVTTPSGNVLTGIDAVKERFIPFDLQFMDRVEFLTDFTESDGKLSWSQTYYEVNGNTFTSECEVTLENSRIVEWVFR